MTVSFECSVIYIRVFCAGFFGLSALCGVFWFSCDVHYFGVYISIYIYIDLYIYIYINLSSSCLWARVFWCLLCMHR